ncbi:MAG: ABC transporter substrate-binding protein [Bacteroidales bacterium]
MKRTQQALAILVMLVMLAACVGKQSSTEDFNIKKYNPQYALGFELVGAKGMQSTILEVHKPWQGAENIKTQLFIARNGERVPQGFSGQVIKGDAKRIVCMSSSHVAMLDAAGAVKYVVGVSGIDFISNKYISSHTDSIADVGYDGGIDYEKLVGISPDLVLLYGVRGASTMEPKLRELDIPFIYIGEYLEESPLGKAEWLVAVSELIGKRTDGEEYFKDIPTRYNKLKAQAAAANSDKPTVMLNAPYGDSWFMPSTASYMARLIADAGGEYLYDKNTSTSSLAIDLEEAYFLTQQADVWINVGGLSSLEEFKTAYPKFADAPCVVAGQIYNSTKRINPSGGNDFWESGVVNPDLILRDLTKIFHPEIISDDFYYYLKLH